MSLELTQEQARNIARILWGARQRQAREEAARQPQSGTAPSPHGSQPTERGEVDA